MLKRMLVMGLFAVFALSLAACAQPAAPANDNDTLKVDLRTDVMEVDKDEDAAAEGDDSKVAGKLNLDMDVVKDGDKVAGETDLTIEAQVKSFTVVGSNFVFAPSSLKVKKGDTVRITFTSGGGMHDFVLDGFGVKTKQLADGASETVEFAADKTGSFEFYCSVGTHRSMGMVGTLVVE